MKRIIFILLLTSLFGTQSFAQEILEKRTRSSKTFLLETLPDGRQRFALDSTIGAIHYKDVEGTWQDIKFNWWIIN